MDSEKKRYTTPQLSVYGKLEEITQQGGRTATDVPKERLLVLDWHSVSVRVVVEGKADRARPSLALYPIQPTL